jgi:hypothetical protein
LAQLRVGFSIFENSEDAALTIGPFTFRTSAKLLLEPATNRRIYLTEKGAAAALKFPTGQGARWLPGAVEHDLG